MRKGAWPIDPGGAKDSLAPLCPRVTRDAIVFLLMLWSVLCVSYSLSIYLSPIFSLVCVCVSVSLFPWTEVDAPIFPSVAGGGRSFPRIPPRCAAVCWTSSLYLYLNTHKEWNHTCFFFIKHRFFSYLIPKKTKQNVSPTNFKKLES